MGIGYTLTCKACNKDKPLSTGVGKWYDNLENVMNPVHWSRREKVLDFRLDRKVVKEEFEHKLYRCETCSTLHSRFWVKIESEDGSALELGFKCGKCKSTLDMVGEEDVLDSVGDYTCETCDENTLTIEADVLWD